MTAASSHWLDRYSNGFHKWQVAASPQYGGATTFVRPLGVVEAGFDGDGRYFEGRADVTSVFKLECRHSLSKSQFRHRICLAWAVLRLHHGILRSTVDYDSTNLSHKFVVSVPKTADEALDEAVSKTTFVEDYYQSVDEDDFRRHLANASRVLNPDSELAKLFVLPNVGTKITLMLVMAHQITDGLSIRSWTTHLAHLLNCRLSQLQAQLEEACNSRFILAHLPVPQEDHYPRISGSNARRRWFWLLSIVLRHVRKPLPASFQNPLRRPQPLKQAVAFPPTYSSLLNYKTTPPLNSFTANAKLGKTATKRLHRLCRQAGTSIGAGSFVLVGMVMMLIHECRYPHETSRQPFIGSFPINPRAFFNHRAAPDSLMLAFSDGVVLPFLPSHLDIEGRFRLLVRTAHRQLSIYQKRVRPQDTADQLAYMGSRGAGRIVALNYIAAVEREQSKLPPHLRSAYANLQGDLPAQPNGSLATCGVSSIGRVDNSPLKFDLSKPAGDGEDAFVVSFVSMLSSVRARDGEFLVGIAGNDELIEANVSFDGNAIDEARVEEWRYLMATLLEPERESAAL